MEERIMDNVIDKVILDQLSATGTLTVDNNNETKKVLKPKKIELPKVGTSFLIGNIPYVVTYVNEGQGRFTSTPKRQ